MSAAEDFFKKKLGLQALEGNKEKEKGQELNPKTSSNSEEKLEISFDPSCDPPQFEDIHQRQMDTFQELLSSLRDEVSSGKTTPPDISDKSDTSKESIIQKFPVPKLTSTWDDVLRSPTKENKEEEHEKPCSHPETCLLGEKIYSRETAFIYKALSPRQSFSKVNPICLAKCEINFPSYNPGNLVTATDDIICYVIKGKLVRLLHRGSPLRAVFRNHQATIIDLVPAPSRPNTLASLSSDGTLHVWEVRIVSEKLQVNVLKSLQLPVDQSDHTITRFSFHPTRFSLAVSTKEGRLYHVPLDNDNRREIILETIIADIHSTIVDISHQGDFIAIGNAKGTVTIVSLLSLDTVFSFSPYFTEGETAVAQRVIWIPATAPLLLTANCNCQILKLWRMDFLLGTSDPEITPAGLALLKKQIDSSYGGSSQTHLLQTLDFALGPLTTTHLNCSPSGHFLFVSSPTLPALSVLHLQKPLPTFHETFNYDSCFFNSIVDFATREPFISFSLVESKNISDELNVLSIQLKSIQIFHLTIDQAYPPHLHPVEDFQKIQTSPEKVTKIQIPPLKRSIDSESKETPKNEASLSKKDTLKVSRPISKKDISPVPKKELPKTTPLPNKKDENRLLSPLDLKNSLNKETVLNMSDILSIINDGPQNIISDLKEKDSSTTSTPSKKVKVKKPKKQTHPESEENIATPLPSFEVDTKKCLPPQETEVMNKLFSSLETELLNKLLPSLQGELEEKLTLSLKGTISSHLTKLIPTEIKKTAISKAVAASLSLEIEKSFIKTFDQKIIPSFQKATSTMLKQMNVNLASGLDNVMGVLDGKIATTVERIDSINSAQQHYKTSTDDIRAMSETLLDKFEALSNKFEALEARLNTQHINNNAATSPSRSYLLSSPQNPLSHLKQFIATKAYPDAFNLALSAGRLDLVDFIISTVPVDEVFPPSGTVLNQFIILSLIQQLGVDLVKTPELKLAWLRNSVLALEPENSQASQHIPEILTLLIQSLEKVSFIPPFSDHLQMDFKILSHIINSVLKSFSP